MIALTTIFFLIRSILHDLQYFKNPMEYQLERYLKDGKLNPAVMDPAFAAFGFGRRSVNHIPQRGISHGEPSSVFVLEDTLATTRYI